MRQALAVHHFYREGDQYIVADGKVVIVDECTGRVMDERSWNDGMHQLVEAKEGVKVTARKEVLARVTYQRFFRRYRRLSGMTGTASEVAAELSSVYRLAVVPIPTNVRNRRDRLPTRVFARGDSRWRSVAERARSMAESGGPVLIGTRSVAASETASAALHAAGLPHVLLNAKNDRGEAEIIAQA